MGIEVVHDKYDLITIRITDIYKILTLSSSVNCGSVLMYAYMPYVVQRFYEYKYAAITVTYIFIIKFWGIS